MKVQPMSNNPGRFVIVDDHESVIDDANGYGYKSQKSANKAMWYKFGGGKEKKAELEKRKKQFFREYPGMEKYLDTLYETWFKEIARGEFTQQDLIKDIQEKFGVAIPVEFLN